MLSRGYSTPQHPIWGVFETQQAKALKAAGHKVVVICGIGAVHSVSPSKFNKFGISKFIIDDIPIYSCFYLSATVVMQLLGYQVYANWFAAQYNKVFEKVVQDLGVPDVVYSHYLYLNCMGANIHDKFNVPVVGVEHWSEVNRPDIKPDIKQLADNTYHRLNRLIAVSDSFAQTLKERFNVESKVVNNMVEIDYSYKLKSKKETECVKIVSVGRLKAPKQFSNLIEAMKMANLSIDSWQLTIVGGGPDEVMLKEKTKKLGLSKNILFTGMASHEQVCKELSKGDFFVLPSEYETFGVSYVEAMSYGLPVIGTKCGGPESIINSNNGLLVANNDVNALAEAIKTMMTTYKNYSPEAIQAEMKAKYSPEAIIPQIINVMNEAIEDNNKK